MLRSLRSLEFRRFAKVLGLGAALAALAASTGCAASDATAIDDDALVADVDVDGRDTTAPAALSAYVTKANGEKQGGFKGGLVDGDPPPPPPASTP